MNGTLEKHLVIVGLSYALSLSGAFAQAQSPSQTQIPGACSPPKTAPTDTKAENDVKVQAYLLCLAEQQRDTRAIDDGLRRNSPGSGRPTDPNDRRSGETRDTHRR